jgi:hypothetical protein
VTKRRAAWFLAIAALPLGVLGAGARGSFSEHVDREGEIRLPPDFRARMVHLGSWFVPEGDASGLHDVYTELASLEAFRKTGQFPDGATLVKEVRASRAGTYTTGRNVAHATDDVKQIFVMVKDGTGRFPGDPAWGEGWGWALFKPGSLDRSVVEDFRSDCLGCHAPARANDWVYLEGYPTLRIPDGE